MKQEFTENVNGSIMTNIPTTYNSHEKMPSVASADFTETNPTHRAGEMFLYNMIRDSIHLDYNELRSS